MCLCVFLLFHKYKSNFFHISVGGRSVLGYLIIAASGCQRLKTGGKLSRN